MSAFKIKKIILVISTALCSISSYSQNREIDSLKNLLEKTSEDTVKVYRMYKISDEYFNSTVHDTAMIYARQALKLAEDIDYKRGQARSLTRMGNIFEATGNFPDALKNHFSALERSEKLNDIIGIGAAYNNIARVYTGQKTPEDFKKAITYYMKTKAIFEKLNDADNLNTALLNIGDNYEKMDQLDSALFYQTQAYSMAVANENVNYMGVTLVNLGYIHFKKGNMDSAFCDLRRGIQYLIESDDKESLPDAWNSLSDCFEKTGQIDSSVYYAKKALSMAEAGSNLEASLDAANQLSSLYELKNKYDSALFFKKMSTRIDSSIYDKQKTAQIQALNFKEEDRQQVLEEERVASEKKRQDNLQVISISVFIITFFVILIILSQKKINPRAIEILGVLGLLLVFEFITIFIHPFIGELTHHSPIYMLVILVIIAAVLGPLHHYLTKWLKDKLVHGKWTLSKKKKPHNISEDGTSDHTEVAQTGNIHPTVKKKEEPKQVEKSKGKSHEHIKPHHTPVVKKKTDNPEDNKKK